MPSGVKCKPYGNKYYTITIKNQMLFRLIVIAVTLLFVNVNLCHVNCIDLIPTTTTSHFIGSSNAAATFLNVQPAALLPFTIPPLTSSTYSELNSIKDQSMEIISTDHIATACINKCPEENRTNSEHINVGCGTNCYMTQCSLGCSLWETALTASCQSVCNKTDGELLEPKELYCVMGCNDALNRYFKWLRNEVGTPAAPALVADTLTATSLSLEWVIPPKLAALSQEKPYSPKSYLVQWRYEEVDGDWKFYRNQSMGYNSTVRVDNLQPYTKYRFRVAVPLSLSLKYDEILVSSQSVIISTLASGVPLSKPAIVRAVAVDHTRISVSWEPGPFPNGPILSYSLEIKILSSEGYSSFKDIAATENTNFYLFDKLLPSKNYTVEVSMRNAAGEGPKAEMIVTTPTAPPVNINQPEPRLILGAEFSVMSQGSDILSEPPKEFYRSTNRILGVAIHIAKSLVFVSDAARFIYKAPLEPDLAVIKNKKEVILSSESGVNFSPTLLSLDWLNNQLYILGEVDHSNSQKLYQISRCNLNGQGLTVAIAGLSKTPNHIQVDPLNGYLYWVISGLAAEDGLFRLDIGDISNGVKHEIRPLHLIQGGNLGAFVVDYTKFKLLIPAQDANTVYAVSLDGKDKEDIRKNTQSPKLNLVKSLAMANGIFYWTNGSDLFMEDHHKEEDNYYHNAYPGKSNGTFISVSVNLPSAQPIPIPVNPPREVQALLSSRKAKISWNIPHLLGNQGKGSWQEWNYELKIIDGTNVNNVIRDIKGTYFTVDRLKPNTNYTFLAAAYTSAGRGPYSTEFNAKTLKSNHDRYLIWSSNDGLLQSDVIGEHIHTLISKTVLGDHDISDMAWFEDMLFFVSNSTLKYYNRTSNILKKFNDIDTVESIAIDWIGKRIYWSIPSQQYITRTNFDGLEKEYLSILGVVKEFKIDSLNGHIYYSTGSAVEACRLNGKNRISYINFQPYSGQVMGLTLDMDNERIFWIVRSYNGSNLYVAPMATYWHKDMKPTEIPLIGQTLSQTLSLNRLTHFSDRLLWLQDDRTVIVGDMTGRNLAKIRNDKLNGLKSISVIDPTHHVFPANYTNDINVIPEPILNTSIQFHGTWHTFNISWSPVQTVNYGEIFYEIRIKYMDYDLLKEETSLPYFYYTNHNLVPYTLLDISIRPFTYWGSAKTTIIQLHSPVAAPSQPTQPRVFISHHYNPFRRGLNISATFRWNQPDKPNGPIIGYKITCWHNDSNRDHKIIHDFHQDIKEMTISNLSPNITYYFQIQAFTSPDVPGHKTLPISINSSQENPIPKLLLAKIDQILEIDLDLNLTKILVHTGNPATHLAYIENEKKIFWINENRELISFNCNNNQKIKIALMQHDVLALTIDWIQRVIYWVQNEKYNHDSINSVIYYLDLNRYEERPIIGKKLLTIQGSIKDLTIAPMNQRLYWIQFDLDDLTYGHLKQFNLNTNREVMWPKYIQCLNDSFEKIVLDTQSFHENHLILINQNNQLAKFGLQSQKCQSMPPHLQYNKNLTKYIVRDSSNIYLLQHNQTIIRYNQQSAGVGKDIIEKYHLNITHITDILAYNHQMYPHKICLLPKKNILHTDYIVELVQKTENSLLLQLPQLQSYTNCTLKLTGIKYIIQYAEHKYTNLLNCPNIYCKSLISYDSLTEIINLKPFTKYNIQIGVTNFYAEQNGFHIIYGPLVTLSTAPGAPSMPRNLSAETISPTEAYIKWLQPLELNSDQVWYEIHWQTENPISRVVNKQQRIVSIDENLILNSSNQIAIKLSKLMPSQKYTVWIEAFSTNHTFSSTPIIEIEMFSEPENITILETTAYHLYLHWKTPQNISKYILEYSMIGTGGVENFTIVVDSENDTRIYHDIEMSSTLLELDDRNMKENYFIDDLQPKTMYRFSVRLYYSKRDVPYIWPPDNRFVFETLGDRPTAPGKPIIRHVSGDVYKVSWDSSKENGATIEEYSLEALQSRVSNRVRRSTEDNDDDDDDDDDDQDVPMQSGGINDIQNIESNATASANNNSLSFDNAISVTEPEIIDNNTSLIHQMQSAEEPEPFEETWMIYCNGTENHCIKNDFNQVSSLTFRVRARNSYGWGPYSSESEPISEPYISPQRRDSLMIAIFVPVMIVASCVIFAGTMIFVHQKRSTAKKLLYHSRIPDVELANLRELPRGGNFIHSSNILYCHGPLTDADVALLPHIRRDQITMSCFLGSGAFGEVYEGIVRNVNDNPEVRVAIKTLRKGATEQEKGEFLQEAQLMSNFKHKHILKLIGVCFDSESLFIIMELMQGGDLLSYLRQSRPTIGVPSSLTLLDLISMCVDVAAGCRYLEEMHFVHRDLACRNCLVSSVDHDNRVVKIGDFGLARDIYKNDYYRKEGEGLLPVRWMSPESLVDGVFTSQSDIWAFGVLCWEIMTLGQQPYPARNNVEVLHHVRDGGRLDRPVNCPDELYQLLLKCWSYRPEERPTFRYCLETLEVLKSSTNENIHIIAHHNVNRGVHGGIFNPSYLTLDHNHNHTNHPAHLKLNSNDDNPRELLEPPIILTPTSSTTSTIIPKYLELLYDDNDDIQQHTTTNILCDGYEIPVNVTNLQNQQECVACCIDSTSNGGIHNTNSISTQNSLCSHNDSIEDLNTLKLPSTPPPPEIIPNNNNKERTFSSSSTVSRSSSPITTTTTTTTTTNKLCNGNGNANLEEQFKCMNGHHNCDDVGTKLTVTLSQSQTIIENNHIEKYKINKRVLVNNDNRIISKSKSNVLNGGPLYTSPTHNGYRSSSLDDIKTAM